MDSKMMFQGQNCRKYFVQNQIIQSKNVQFRPPIFGHLFVHQKCPFWPLRVGVLKTRNTKHKKSGL
jgi:hypothetical protein